MSTVVADRFGCLGDQRITASGYINALNPRPQDFTINSIAMGLSHACRFSGQCSRMYTVLEHSYHAVMLYLVNCHYFGVAIDTNIARAILLHDASEAFLSDIARPIKPDLPDYVALEAKYQSAIYERFNVDNSEHVHKVVKSYDNLMLKAEKRFLFPNDDEPWAGMDEIETVRIPFFAQYDEMDQRDRFKAMGCYLGIVSIDHLCWRENEVFNEVKESVGEYQFECRSRSRYYR